MRIPNMLELVNALNTPLTVFSAADDRAAVEKYLTEHAADAEQMKELAARYQKEPIGALRFETYRQFDTTGERNDYQGEYFPRRDRLEVMTMCCYLFGEEQYLKEAENCIWAICDEYTWCLPAHLGGKSLEIQPLLQKSGEKDGLIKPYEYSHRNLLDLFACETARQLAETLRLLGDRLDPLVRRRAVTDIIDRVFEQYLAFNQVQHFEINLSNWSAVCGGSLGVAALYLIESPEQLAPVIQRVISDLDVFIGSYGEDGIGREGVGYWNYGFYNFCYFACLLRERTAGKLDLFRDDKVKKAAFFPVNAFLYRNYGVNFSDCREQGTCQEEVLQCLMSVYPDMPAPTVLCESGNGGSRSTPITLRKLFWSGGKKGEDFRERSEYYENAGWLVSCVKSGDTAFSFVIKGGHNDEPHNHNDLGNFILYADGEQLLSDLGGGEYTKDYFSDGRYGYLVTSSRGHSVPIVEGVLQKEGEDAAAEVLNTKTGGDTDVIAMELKSAYPCPKLKSCVREARIRRKEFSVELNDTFQINKWGSEPDDTEKGDISSLHVTERFVTRFKPEIDGKTAVIRGARHAIRIVCGSTDAVLRVDEEQYRLPDREIGTAYLINYECEIKEEQTVRFRFVPEESESL